MKNVRAVLALCGSFCTFSRIMPLARQLCEEGWQVQPLLSFNAARLDTRFGTAQSWIDQLRQITGREPLCTLQEAEPLGPADLADLMIIAPCTGATLAKLACGISDTPVTLGAKSMLRAGKPIVLAPSTNDGLMASAQNLAALLNRKHYYVVPFAQDDFLNKPASLQSRFELTLPAAKLALQEKQLQPLLWRGEK